MGSIMDILHLNLGTSLCPSSSKVSVAINCFLGWIFFLHDSIQKLICCVCAAAVLLFRQRELVVQCWIE